MITINVLALLVIVNIIIVLIVCYINYKLMTGDLEFSPIKRILKNHKLLRGVLSALLSAALYTLMMLTSIALIFNI